MLIRLQILRKPCSPRTLRTEDQMAKKKETKRKPGRPPGTGTGKTTKRYGISLPLDVAAWLDAQPIGPSATIVAALREKMNS